MNKEVKRLFTPVPLVSPKNSRKLSSYMVRATLYPLKMTVRSFKCKKPHGEVV